MPEKKESSFDTIHLTFFNYANKLSPIYSRPINYSKNINVKNEKTQKIFIRFNKNYYDMKQLTIKQNAKIKKWNSHILNKSENSKPFNKKDIININYFNVHQFFYNGQKI